MQPLATGNVVRHGHTGINYMTTAFGFWRNKFWCGNGEDGHYFNPCNHLKALCILRNEDILQNETVLSFEKN